MESYRLRVRLFAAAIVGVFVILSGRLVYLQVFDSETYWGASQSNAVRERPVVPARGALYDREGTLLVDNAPSYTLMFTPRYVDESTLPELATLLGVADSVVTARLSEARDWSSVRPSRAFSNLDFDTYSRIQERLYRLPGVSFDVDAQRRYHTDMRAPHALGYVREIDGTRLAQLRDTGYRPGDRIGVTGIESAFESELRGTYGSEFVVVDVRGMEVQSYRDGAEDRPPESGYNLHLTIDHEVQALAESLFVNKRGAAVALDPDSGEIISFVSHPDYDPDLFAQSIPTATWDSLQSNPDDPLYNRATMSGFPPGSTWKPFMSLVGLEEGIIPAGKNQLVDCPAGYQVGSRTFRNHQNKSHGRISLEEALEVSCNTLYYDVMMNLDVNTWAEWARRFGFGQEVPFDVSNQLPGLIPDSSYFDRTYGRWTAGYTVNLGIGQGDMSVTPLQMARYTAALANGGDLPSPHFVRYAEHPATGERIMAQPPLGESTGVAPEHLDRVNEGMRRVMESGTGQWVSIPDIESAGKTGTAENPHGENHSLFIMFAPFDDPEIAIAVAVENAGYGGSVAGPIASFMAEKYLTGSIADTWERRYWMDRLLNEERSAPITPDVAPDQLDPEERQSEGAPAVPVSTP
ncbi:MAG: penicillin-binding protein 2 [Longimonas sp.]|uniref:penicillin-binding protein 2 n=1 Tax=Longimonas sp. TaxID=2039626 RepID=UPI0039764788